VRHLEYPLLVDNEFHIIQSQSLPPPLEAFEMPSVGPELPPHLIKRKRSIDDEEGLNSPPRKVQAALGPMLPHAQNPDELDIEESSQDEFGPSIPSKAPAQNLPHSKRVLGPAPPPTTNPDALDLSDSDDDDEYGPSKPSVKASTPPKRILGPAPPPASLAEMPSHPPTADSDSSSDDDDYGPSLPPAPGSAAEAALLEQQAEERFTAARTTQVAPKLQREEWMLAPPSDSDWTGRVDPTKLKNRKFASGKGSKAPAEKTGVSAIWTETPEQKRQRSEDEVLGKMPLHLLAPLLPSLLRWIERKPQQPRESKNTTRRTGARVSTLNVKLHKQAKVKRSRMMILVREGLIERKIWPWAEDWDMDRRRRCWLKLLISGVDSRRGDIYDLVMNLNVLAKVTLL
jgi:hypothetical protein